MKRSLKLPLLIALALGSTPLLAVDLGQIQVKSALGQPLLAEIPVHAATPEELQHLTAQLASSDEFARAGIAGGRTAIPLHFSVADAAGGQRVIRITSTTPVEDPFLDLLIEVNAQSGKSVREFAILLDPPGSAAPAALAAAPAPAPQAQPAPVRQPLTHAATPPRAQTAAGAVARTPPRTVAAATRTAPAAGGQYGPVVRGDTLSAIARTATPAGVDIHQMLLAIKQANPDAFYRDNINALKAGAILRLPTATEAQTMAVVAAIAEVRRQNGDWNAKAAVSPATVADTATRASASSAPTHAAADTNDRLALVPAKDGADAAGSGAGSQGNASATTLQRDLLRAQESLASVQQQSADLKTQVKDLTDINDKNTRLLSLKDSEIADLQAKLAAARQGVAVAPAGTASATAPVAAGEASMAAAGSVAPAPVGASTAAAPAVSGTVGAAEVAAAAVASTAAASTPVAAASAPAAAAAAPDAAASTSNPVTSAPWYMQTWAWAAGAGAVVLLLLLALLGRRRKPLADAAGGSSSSLADRFVAAPETGATAAADAEQDDLLDQLAERPDDVGLHLELVTLYYSRRDVERFEAAAEAMHAHVTDPQQDEWQDVVHMGEDLVPGHPLFDHHVEVPPFPAEDPLEGFDIDDYADAPTDDAVGVPSASATDVPLADSPKPVSGYAFDFDLTAHPVLPPDLPTAAPARADVSVSTAAPTADSSPAAAPEVDAAASTWQFEQSDGTSATTAADDLGEFNDDPVDTKLDLARAYLDMGDAEGARAMLGEVIKEGSQTQQDVARELLGKLPH